MKNATLLTLLTCATLITVTPCGVRAQNVPAGTNAPAAGAPGRGGGGRGGGRGQAQPPGPPAPVPPEVAIPRPTADEFAKLHADISQFIETSSDKDLLKKYASLITVQPGHENSAIRPTGGGGGQHQGFVNTANTGDFDIIFLGDSITALWTTVQDGQGNEGGKAMFDKYFAGMKIVNFGIPGDSTQGVLWRLQNGEGQGHKPKAVMLLIGTNNNGNTGEEIAEGIGANVLELRKDFPDAKILLMAIFPRGTGPSDSNRRKMDAVNKIIAKLDDQKHVFFMNINDKFLDANGGLIGFRTSDHLHPVPAGYEIWASAVAPILKSWTN